MMFETRIHGRGGQGVVTAAELLSVAAFAQGWHAQAVPSFGSERTGAPVVAYCRLDERPIRSHEPVTTPDCVVVQDPTLLHLPVVMAGLRPEGHLVVNSSRSPAELGLPALAPSLDPHRVLTLPATELAREHLGRPLPNTALLGAVAALTGVVGLDALAQAIHERFAPQVAEANERLARAAFALVAERVAEPTGGGRRAQAG